MDDDVSNDLDPAERAELAALRHRAYAPGADIDGNPIALARLAELEDRARRLRPDAATPRAVSAPVDAANRAKPRARVRTRLVMVSAVVAVFVGGSAVSPATESFDLTLVDSSARSSTAVATAEAPIPTVADHTWGMSFAESYFDNLNRLRTAVLSGTNTEFESILRRLDVDRLLPKGTIDGRSVWAGPTIDGAMCLVLGGEGGPIVGCTTRTSIAKHGLSVTAPAANATWDSPDPANTPAAPLSSYAPVMYTLLADGNVITEAITP